MSSSTRWRRADARTSPRRAPQAEEAGRERSALQSLAASRPDAIEAQLRRTSECPARALPKRRRHPFWSCHQALHRFIRIRHKRRSAWSELSSAKKRTSCLAVASRVGSRSRAMPGSSCSTLPRRARPAERVERKSRSRSRGPRRRQLDGDRPLMGIAMLSVASAQQRQRQQQRRQPAVGHCGFAIDARSNEFASLLRLATAVSRTAAARSSAEGSGWFALKNLISGAPLASHRSTPVMAATLDSLTKSKLPCDSIHVPLGTDRRTRELPRS
jgi:hypothetical protein